MIARPCNKVEPNLSAAEVHDRIYKTMKDEGKPEAYAKAFSELAAKIYIENFHENISAGQSERSAEDQAESYSRFYANVYTKTLFDMKGSGETDAYSKSYAFFLAEKMAGGEKFAEAKPYADIFAKVYVEEIGNGVSDKDAKETAKYAAEIAQAEVAAKRDAKASASDDPIISASDEAKEMADDSAKVIADIKEDAKDGFTLKEISDHVLDDLIDMDMDIVLAIDNTIDKTHSGARYVDNNDVDEAIHNAAKSGRIDDLVIHIVGANNLFIGIDEDSSNKPILSTNDATIGTNASIDLLGIQQDFSVM
jgi:hypothetical protein